MRFLPFDNVNIYERLFIPEAQRTKLSEHSKYLLEAILTLESAVLQQNSGSPCVALPKHLQYTTETVECDQACHTSWEVLCNGLRADMIFVQGS